MVTGGWRRILVLHMSKPHDVWTTDSQPLDPIAIASLPLPGHCSKPLLTVGTAIAFFCILARTFLESALYPLS